MFLDSIVVPVDFSPASDAAWRAACDLARLGDGTLHVVHVCAEPLRQAWAGEAAAGDMEAIARQRALEAAERLARLAVPRDIDPARVTRTVLSGCVHREIVGFAAERHAGVIVMGAHGHGPLWRLLLGSVTERVLRTAGCPVMVVRPADAASERSRAQPRRIA